VTEFSAATGTLVQVLTSANYQFDAPDGAAFDGAHVWVTNATGETVTELKASDGSLVQVLTGSSYGFLNPKFIAFDDQHLWVANHDAASVTSSMTRTVLRSRSWLGRATDSTFPAASRSMARTCGRQQQRQLDDGLPGWLSREPGTGRQALNWRPAPGVSPTSRLSNSADDLVRPVQWCPEQLSWHAASG